MRVKAHNTMVWTSSAQTARFRAAMEEQQRAHLAKRIKELRLYNGWTEADLWQEAGVSIQTISRLENAKTENPRENTLQSLAKAFGITRDDLAGPRVSPQEVERAYESQLDRIEQKLDDLLAFALERALGDAQPPDEKEADGSEEDAGGSQP